MKQEHAKIVLPENVASEFEKIRRLANSDEMARPVVPWLEQHLQM